MCIHVSFDLLEFILLRKCLSNFAHPFVYAPMFYILAEVYLRYLIFFYLYYNFKLILQTYKLKKQEANMPSRALEYHSPYTNLLKIIIHAFR